MKLTFKKQCLLSKLADELISNGINPIRENNTSAIHGTETEVYIYIPDDTPQDMIDQITTIVNAHDPTPLPPQPTQDDYLLDLDYRLCKIELGI